MPAPRLFPGMFQLRVTCSSGVGPRASRQQWGLQSAWWKLCVLVRCTSEAEHGFSSMEFIQGKVPF